MPELPEIETLVRQLREKISGTSVQKIFLSPEARINAAPSVFHEKLPGKKIQTVARRGKFLRFELEGGTSLWLHLGMTGQLVWHSGNGRPDRHAHFILSFREISEKLIFRDTRKFGRICLTNGPPNGEARPEGGRPEFLPDGIRLLRPEPFDLAEEAFVRIFKNRKGRIKNLLLPQDGNQCSHLFT